MNSQAQALLNRTESLKQDISSISIGLNVKNYGAAGDGIKDDTAAVKAAIAAHLATGVPLIFPAGIYQVADQILIDVSSLLLQTGINISGAGRRRTILRSSYTAASPFVLQGGGAFYHQLADIGLEGNYAGPVLRIGKDDYSDAFNSCSFERLNVNNSSLNAAAEGVRLNYVLQSTLDIVANCGGSGRPGATNTPGYGAAIVLRQVQFSALTLAGGNANIGLKITAGYNFGNSFSAMDLEEVDTGIKIDSANATKNTFLGGTVVATKCLDGSAGASNAFHGVNLSPYSGGTVFNGTNRTGLYIRSPGSSQAVNSLQADDALPGGAAALRAFGPDANIVSAYYSKGTGNHDFFASSGEQLYSIRYTASAVNFFRAIPTAAGSGPTHDAVGTDTNIDHVVRAKGTGSFKATSSNGATYFVAQAPAASVNFPQVVGSIAGAAVEYKALGADANINLQLSPKGSGAVVIPIASVLNYADDTAAATGGVPVGGIYRTASALKIRAA